MQIDMYERRLVRVTKDQCEEVKKLLRSWEFLWSMHPEAEAQVCGLV